MGEFDRAAVRKSELGLSQRIGALGVAEHAHRLLRAGDLGAPDRLIGVELAQLHVHLRGGDAIALQHCGIENEPDFAVDATATHARCDAFYLETALDAWVELEELRVGEGGVIRCKY